MPLLKESTDGQIKYTFIVNLSVRFYRISAVCSTLLQFYQMLLSTSFFYSFIIFIHYYYENYANISIFHLL